MKPLGFCGPFVRLIRRHACPLFRLSHIFLLFLPSRSHMRHIYLGKRRLAIENWYESVAGRGPDGDCATKNPLNLKVQGGCGGG